MWVIYNMRFVEFHEFNLDIRFLLTIWITCQIRSENVCRLRLAFDKSRTHTHHIYLFLAPVCSARLSNLKAILFCKSSRHHVIRDTISVPSLQKKANGCNHLCGKQGGCFLIHWVFGWLFASSCPFTHTLRNHIFPFSRRLFFLLHHVYTLVQGQTSRCLN